MSEYEAQANLTKEQANLTKEDDRWKAQKDFLWGMYQEHRNHARHNETLRATAINFLLVTTGALVGLTLYDRMINRDDFLIGITIFILGLLGTLLSLAHTERSLRYRQRARGFLTELDRMILENKAPKTISNISNSADAIIDKKLWYKTLHALSQGSIFWCILPLLICLVGVILAMLARK